MSCTAYISCLVLSFSLSLQTLFLISVIVGIFTTPVILIVDFLCVDILSAPTADSLKVRAEVNPLAQFGRRVSNVARRVSVASINAAKNVSHLVAVTATRRTLVPVIQTTLEVPADTYEAYAQAKIRVRNLLDDVKQENQAFVNSRKTTRFGSLNIEKSRMRRLQGLSQQAVLGADLVGKDTKNKTRKQRSKQSATVVATSLFVELTVDMNDQRRRLRPLEQEDFDNKWG